MQRALDHHDGHGRLFVFEGPDGVGKSTVAAEFARRLSEDRPAVLLSFPGREPGTLGHHVYELHHASARFGVERLSAASLQLLHIAAHLDAIEARIVPLLEAGTTVVLDRYWWSTWVYGVVGGARRDVLEQAIALERSQWAQNAPAAVFLITRAEPFRAETSVETWTRLVAEYSLLAAREAARTRVLELRNDGTLESTVTRALEIAESGRRTAPRPRARALHAKGSSAGTAPHQLGLLPVEPAAAPREHAPCPTRTAWAPAEPTEVFDTYWRFATERQAVFFRRARGLAQPWTTDPILLRHKFTNAYRASDRVSQYLIRHVIYAGEQTPEEVFFRTLLFKLFNRIDTWQRLEKAFGTITWKGYSFREYDRILSHGLERGERIYSGAYIMPAAERGSGTRKHQTHLRLLERMMRDGAPGRIARARSMRQAFELLLEYPMLGNFLAYQYVTDLNYSTLTDFSEMEFVVPGPGALDGIRKCFRTLGGLSEADIIRRVALRQDEEFAARGLSFERLGSRPLQLIDCQNLFCEVDKYARLYHPSIVGRTGRTRIKQLFRATETPVEYWYPPKWDINDRLLLRGRG